VDEQLSPWEEKMRLTARTTTRLLELLDRSVPGDDKLTFAEKARGFGRFPVVGYVWYHDDWGAPRYFPYYHLHEGNDLFAEAGTPVIAVTDGVIWKLAKGGSGGNAVWLLGDDDVRYYYGHLQKHAKDLAVGQHVKQGDLIAYVGASGESAAGTYPHVHFEVNPGGFGTINPKTILDSWLNAAESQALHSVTALRRYDRLTPLGAARWSALTRLFSAPTAMPPALWATALDGTGATLAHADLVLTEILAAQDWISVTAITGATGDLGSTLDRLTPIATSLASHDSSSS
jgi:murein DD-endopeptidase MepM/ murein hydrolase activator NlpD